jgi:hypothetical protein
MSLPVGFGALRDDDLAVGFAGNVNRRKSGLLGCVESAQRREDEGGEEGEGGFTTCRPVPRPCRGLPLTGETDV